MSKREQEIRERLQQYEEFKVRQPNVPSPTMPYDLFHHYLTDVADLLKILDEERAKQ